MAARFKHSGITGSSIFLLPTAMARWVRGWGFLTYYHAVWQVGGSYRGRVTIVGGVFHPTRQLARFSPPSMSSIVNSKFI